jgi:hypothetical protein
MPYHRIEKLLNEDYSIIIMFFIPQLLVKANTFAKFLKRLDK